MVNQLSLGLLASMAMRYDHSFGMQLPPQYETRNQFLKRQRKVLDTMKAYYTDYLLERGERNTQLDEEITGKGFYYLCHEKEYSNYIQCSIKDLL